MPLVIAYEGGTVSGIDFDYLGADGIFGGMIIAIIFSGLFVFFNKKGLVVKLPESVPPKVAESMSPTFIAMIILDRKSTRLNSSHVSISYAVFCLKKKICT